MESKIGLRMFLVGMTALLLTAALSLYLFHGAFEVQVKEDIRQMAQLIAAGCESVGAETFLEEICRPTGKSFSLRDAGPRLTNTLRLTLISPEGQVLFESRADGQLGNHMGRPEVIAAVEHGVGEAVRTSETLGYDTCYYALRLSDGSVLRAAADVKNMYGVYDQALPALCLSAVCVLVLSVVLSFHLTRSLVKPITAMGQSLHNLPQSVPYRELIPFAQAVAKQQEQQQESARMRREFTANVSHELKTPLTSISGYAEMIETGLAKEGDVAEFSGRIREEAGRLLQLIGDIIRLGEMDDEEYRPKLQQVQLDAVAQQTVRRLQWQAQQAYVTLKVQTEPAALCGDERLLMEICYNLCDNAIRYNRPGGMVCISVAAGDGCVRLVVTDDGIGIPKEAQERVFERFYRVDKSRSRATGGTGLGLAIVKHAVQRQGGRIFLCSQPGEGTAITVTFPAAGDGAVAGAADAVSGK